uniref:Uncharacterized protein n=1 Tax=Anguilla anguilla TaxID=7936 RepID=A0A0E9VL34_ANGAN
MANLTPKSWHTVSSKALELDYVNLSEDHLELLKCGIKKKKSVLTHISLCY